VSADPQKDRRQLGRKLARELEQYIRRETPDREAAGQVMLGAYEVFERETRTLRGASPFPPSEGGEDWPPYDSPH
jgi:hypothetical protein